MSKYTKKQVEMFKRIDPDWKEIQNEFFRFHCIQIHKNHPYNICRCQCTGCGNRAGTQMSYGWVTWNFIEHYPHHNQAKCETPYCSYYYKNFQTDVVDDKATKEIIQTIKEEKN